MIKQLNRFLEQWKPIKRLDMFLDRWAISAGMILFVVFMFITTFNTYQVIQAGEEQAQRSNLVLCQGLTDTRQTIRDVLDAATAIGTNFETTDPELKRYIELRERRNIEVGKALEEALEIPAECTRQLQDRANNLQDMEVR